MKPSPNRFIARLVHDDHNHGNYYCLWKCQASCCDHPQRAAKFQVLDYLFGMQLPAANNAHEDGNDNGIFNCLYHFYTDPEYSCHGDHDCNHNIDVRDDLDTHADNDCYANDYTHA
jgi:hypothetical protein